MIVLVHLNLLKVLQFCFRKETFSLNILVYKIFLKSGCSVVLNKPTQTCIKIWVHSGV